MSQFVTVFEVARRYGLSGADVRRQIRLGLLPAKRVGRQWRLRVVDVTRWAEGCRRREGRAGIQ